MFVVYWPVLALAVGLVLIAVVLIVSGAGRICGARHTTLPERPLSSYLQQQVRNEDDMRTRS